MIITKAQFITSSTDVSKCPATGFPEYAFIGRSNVGKSSLINMLTNHRSLAKTSAKPGKTKLINHFLINDSWYIVDLPGYGYAKVSKTERKKWQEFIRRYILLRQSMYCLFLLIDVRLEPQMNDLEFIEWLGINGVPFTLVFTKADKISALRAKENVEIYKQKLLEKWEELPGIFVTSVTTGQGRDEVLSFIENVNLKTGANR